MHVQSGTALQMLHDESWQNSCVARLPLIARGKLRSSFFYAAGAGISCRFWLGVRPAERARPPRIVAVWHGDERSPGGKMSELTADFGSLSQREFRVGGALNKAIKIFFRNAVPFSLVSIVAWLPVGIVIFESLGMPPQERQIWTVLGFVLGSILQLVAVAAILHATFQDMRGRPVRLGESIQLGLRRFFPLIGGGILVALGAGLGLLLLIIPGLMLFVRWYVFAPVCVVEKKGPLGSMGRSAELTKGNRWKLFALFILIAVVGFVTTALITLALSAALSPVAALSLQGVWRGAWSAFGNVLGVVVYHDLRVAKEGVDIESIASVFD
jgi:hypothetical protein